ncbi:MAG TPA: hypothetical protein VN716_18910 [Vicinamibacterales bacterium]|nr:hypothetical protein [Vicinamibacterales bacterium]
MSEAIGALHADMSARVAGFQQDLGRAKEVVRSTRTEFRGLKVDGESAGEGMERGLGKTVTVVGRLAEHAGIARGTVGHLLGGLAELTISGFNPLGIAIGVASVALGVFAGHSSEAEKKIGAVKDAAVEAVPALQTYSEWIHKQADDAVKASEDARKKTAPSKETLTAAAKLLEEQMATNRELMQQSLRGELQTEDWRMYGVRLEGARSALAGVRAELAALEVPLKETTPSLDFGPLANQARVARRGGGQPLLRDSIAGLYSPDAGSTATLKPEEAARRKKAQDEFARKLADFDKPNLDGIVSRFADQRGIRLPDKDQAAARENSIKGERDRDAKILDLQRRLEGDRLDVAIAGEHDRRALVDLEAQREEVATNQHYDQLVAEAKTYFQSTVQIEKDRQRALQTIEQEAARKRALAGDDLAAGFAEGIRQESDGLKSLGQVGADTAHQIQGSFGDIAVGVSHGMKNAGEIAMRTLTMIGDELLRLSTNRLFAQAMGSFFSPGVSKVPGGTGSAWGPDVGGDVTNVNAGGGVVAKRAVATTHLVVEDHVGVRATASQTTRADGSAEFRVAVKSVMLDDLASNGDYSRNFANLHGISRGGRGRG